jgi:NAD(P)-dependent dehydrogenase (short-subunit alcohol dehydrogenase family)
LKKVALITGGARRLGRQISYFLADEGYELAIIYNSSTRAEVKETSDYLKTKKVKFKFYKCDIRNLQQLKKTIEKIGSDFKKLDVLVNNAGIIKKIEFSEITPQLFDDTINTNLRAAFFTTQYCLKYLNKSNAPVIINMASLGGMQNWTGYMPYSISKTAVIKLTYLLARKLAPKIRVNAISPGTIIIEGEEDGTPEKALLEKIPLRKYGKPANIISAVKYILENDYVTGQVLAVEGGRLLN